MNHMKPYEKLIQDFERFTRYEGSNLVEKVTVFLTVLKKKFFLTPRHIMSREGVVWCAMHWLGAE